MYRLLFSPRIATISKPGRAFAVSVTHGSGVWSALSQLKDISVTPEDAKQYQKAVQVYNPAYSYEHPSFVAFPRSVEDVKRCIQVANSTNTPVAVKSGGHCFAGYSTIDSNGFVLSLGKMNRVTHKDDTVTVEAGASWGDVYSSLEDTDYVAVGGCVPAVGIGGYIQGGGYSMLSRAYGGLACDKALAFTMVTADGKEAVRASANENNDLFWALRGGGGGNFGVITDVTLQVCSRPCEFVWSRLTYLTTETSEQGLIAVGKNLDNFPKELNLDIALHGFRGRKELTLDAVYSDHHEDLVQDALKSLHPTETSPPMRFTSFYKFTTEYSRRHGFVHNEVEPIYIKGAMLKSFPTQLARYFAELNIPPECLIEFVHMGGDIQQIPPTATAFVARSAQYSFYTYGRFQGPVHKEEVKKFATSTYEAVKGSGYTIGSYINYMDRELKNWPSEYYGENYNRLCTIKEKWNPIGRGSLHFQQEIGSTWEPGN